MNFEQPNAAKQKQLIWRIFTSWIIHVLLFKFNIVPKSLAVKLWLLEHIEITHTQEDKY